MDGVDSEDLGGDAMTQNDIYKIQRMYGCGKFYLSKHLVWIE